MDKFKDFLLSWWAALVALGSAMITALQAYLDLFGLNIDSDHVLLIGFIVFVIFASIQMVKPQRELNRIKRKLPRLDVKLTTKTRHPLYWFTNEHPKNPEEEYRLHGSMPVRPSIPNPEWIFYQDFPKKSMMSQSKEIHYRTVDDNDFVHIDIANNLAGEEGISKADSVAVKVTFFNMEGKSVFDEDLYGRWENTLEPTSLKPDQFPIDLLAIDIPANGTPRRLTVAVKNKNEPVCYPYYQEWFGKPQNVRAQYALRDRKYYVQASPDGNNTHPKPFWFMLINHGRGSSIDLVQIKPLKLNKSGEIKKMPKKREEKDEKKPSLTREGFFKILRKVTKPKPTDQEKSKTSE